MENIEAAGIETPSKPPGMLPYTWRCLCPKCHGGSGGNDSTSFAITAQSDFSAVFKCHR